MNKSKAELLDIELSKIWIEKNKGYRFKALKEWGDMVSGSREELIITYGFSQFITDYASALWSEDSKRN